MSDARMFRKQPLEFWLRARLEGDDETRWEAVDAIRHLCLPEESIPLLLDSLLNDSYWRARALAAHAFCDLAVDSPEESGLSEFFPRLSAAANDSSVEVQEEIARVLALFSDEREQ